MRRQAARDHKLVDELENRVLVLEDRLETAEVDRGRATQAAPRLPVVHKRAPQAKHDADVGEPTAPTTYIDVDGQEVEVVYEGDAAREDGPRQAVRLHESDAADDMIEVDGDEPARPARARRTPVVRRDGGRYNTEGMPDPADVTDRLPVKKVAARDDAAGAGDVADGADAGEASDPVGAYKAAYAALGRHEHDTAIAGFRKFLERWPAHDYADNAQYWLGEAYYDQRDYAHALVEFREVVKRYPAGNKAPDGLLKIGYCYAKLGDAAAARDVLSQVIEIYPKTDAAKLATNRLDEMRQ